MKRPETLSKKNTISKQGRKKPAKSCYFCRTRKLKCDRERPFCGSCSSRNRKQCNYEESASLEENRLRAKYRRCSKFQMACRIEELESHITKQSDADTQEEKNPLYNMRYLSSKHNRHIIYGPTSYRAILATQTNTFAKYREEIWNVLKLRRNSWKREHHYSTLSEISSIETTSQNSNSRSVVESLCESLPTYEAFRQHLIDFFASDFYHSYQIVNEQKVLKNLQDCFVKGPKNSKTGCHAIIALNLDTKKNYYKVGVMTAIMCLISHPSKVLEAVETFHKVLISFVSAKVFYIERVEFLFLRYLYINVAGLDGGDQSHCIFLHGLTIDTAIYMGLNEDLRRLFMEKVYSIEEIPYLERLWLWILFTDVKISLSTGIPPRISDAFVDKVRLENYSLKNDILLYKTTLKLRSIMEQIHAHKISPNNIPLIIQDLKSFTMDVFKPLNFYLDISNVDGSELTELQLWHVTLHMLASLSNLHTLTCQDYNPIILNASILAPLNTLQLCFKILEGYFELDDGSLPPASAYFSQKWPHLNNALFVFYMGSFRSLIQIYTIFLQRMENKSVQLFMQTNMSSNQNICFGDIEGPHDGCISLRTAFKEMKKIFDTFHQERSRRLTQIWQNSYYFSIIISMEKIGRRVFGKAIQNIDDKRVIEESTSKDNLTTILNDSEELLMEFSRSFTEDILGPSDDFFDTAICGWNDFEDFFF
ncbi:hypothetical protein SEUBUCD646_0O00100 [Saccharomyces eubayanus]|uniref:Zn(2)-C6 fungal-type domain-containing protein n=2 Tax=Saccharomyces TaxID=4930 RepID=A0ABN8VMF4_SACEU|nr:hypothetical protein SEUBUCD650_0O00100 [Saccharomyces eubayanus]CAI1733367.1 hypothetical protein SEUBUCD646_0O00100 [Saccharomyces eubayanus]